MNPTPHRKPRVGLFVTCLVDLMRPSVGFAAVKLLEDAGCIVDAPVQTCCGQPAYNSGDRGTTRALAERMIEAFRGYDYVVVPSGSCAGMIKAHYPELFADDPNWMLASDAATGNWLGRFGASVAHPRMMIVGRAAWAIPLVLLAWGLRFATHRAELKARAVFAPIFVAALAAGYPPHLRGAGGRVLAVADLAVGTPSHACGLRSGGAPVRGRPRPGR